jgi:hypothetical protein
MVSGDCFGIHSKYLHAFLHKQFVDVALFGHGEDSFVFGQYLWVSVPGWPKMFFTPALLLFLSAIAYLNFV